MAKIRRFFYENIWKYILRFYRFIQRFLKEKVFSSHKNTILFTAALIAAALFLIQLYIIIFNKSVYNNNSDDILQYYVILNGFIRSIKDGSLTFFDLNNYFGASIFSNLYYVPLDVFTLITLIFSFVMPTVIAISLTEMVKIIAGVVLIMIYLTLKKYKTRTIFWVGLIYLVNGGSVSFMNFPAFLTMTVYLPLALIVIHYFFEKKYYVVPLYVLLIVFYNFYLAYMLLAFISFAYIIEYFKFHQFNLKKFLLNGVGFLSLLLLGVVMSSVVLLPAITFISEETIRSSVTFNPWVIDLKFIEIQLFDIQVYIRYFAKLYSPQRPVSFRGFLGDYKLEHVSNYMTILGLVFMLLIFFMKDKKARVYQIMFGALLIFTIFPVFSSVFSGTYVMELLGDGSQTAYPYNRWLNVMPVLEVLVIAHVIRTYQFKSFKTWQIWAVGIPVLALGTFLVIYYGNHLADEEGFVLTSLTYDRRFMIASLVILSLGLVIALFKEFQWLKPLIFIEVVLAVGYMFASGFGSYNRIPQFSEMNDINRFLVQHIDDDQFTRVYVDMDEFEIVNRNFNQSSVFPTNTRVFHSWTDAETDDLAYLLFNTVERQSKNKMNYYSYYLSAFLGYRYVLTKPIGSSFESSDQFELIASNDDFALYEINNIDSFYVYNKYMTFDELKSLKRRFDLIAAERAFLKAVMIDEERYQDIYDFDNFFLEHVSDEDVEYTTSSGSIRAWSILYVNDEIVRSTLANPSENSTYYVYDDFNIDYQSGEVTLRDNNHDISSFGEVFYLNEDGEEILCNLEPYDTDRTVMHCGQFFSPIEEIYVEKTADLFDAPFFVKRLERAISGRSYLVYDLSSKQDELDNRIVSFSFDDYDIEKNFIVNEDGEEINSINGIYISPSQVDRIYVFKTGDMYTDSNNGTLDLFTELPLEYSAFEPVDDDFVIDREIVENKFLSIDHSKINLSYDYINTSTEDNIVVIPVTYSDDWQYTSDVIYDKISVSGGFLGIIIPEGTDHVDIQLKFVPKDLNRGAQFTLIGSLVFIGLVAYPVIKNKLKRGEKNDESKVDRTSI